MNAFAILRLAVFGVVLLFSLICLGLSGNFVAQTSGWSFPGFALAVAILTFVITIPMLVIDMVRKGAVVSWVAIELGWVGLLWVLWVATAGLSTSTLLFTVDCGDLYYTEYISLCRQYSALQGFQWLTWLVLFFYFVLVIILAIMATVKGNSRAWLAPTSELSFSPQQMNSGEPKFPAQPYPGQQPYAVTPAGQPGSPMMQPGAFPGSPGPTYQSPMPTGGGYAAPGTPQMGYAQPGQYTAPYGQPVPSNPNAAQV